MSTPVPPSGSSADPAAEQPLWSGTPSQWINFWPFLLAAIAIAISATAAIWFAEPLALIPAGFAAMLAFWPWLQVRCTRIDVTTERIGLTTGVFTRRRRDMELYRVKDTTLHEPFFLRLVGLSNIEVISSDKTSPVLVLHAIRGGEALRQQIRLNVEKMRLEKRVRELDVE